MDVRLVYATHRDLSVFREDIRYRVTAHAVYLKPRRERVEDIVPLAEKFLKDFAVKSGKTVVADKAALCLLETAPWYGNIRELRSFIEKACMDALFASGKAVEQLTEIILTKTIVENRLSKDQPGSVSRPRRGSRRGLALIRCR